MKAIVIQPSGLGDILFLIKLIKKIIINHPDLEITWPVSEYYSYIDEYIAIDNVNFVNENDNFELKEIYLKKERGIFFDREILVLNFSSADEIVPPQDNNKPMYCKYELAGSNNFTNWDNYVDIKRNFEREAKLEEHFNNPTNFNLVNRIFATYPHIQKSDIVEQKNEIEISNLGFDRIFDWCGLIEKCDNFYTVETSFCYLAKLLNKNNVFVYPRNTITNFKYVSKLFPTDWKYITF